MERHHHNPYYTPRHETYTEKIHRETARIRSSVSLITGCPHKAKPEEETKEGGE